MSDFIDRFAAATHSSDSDTPCPDCVAANGLCDREECRRDVLPGYAVADDWLALIAHSALDESDRCSRGRAPRDEE